MKWAELYQRMKAGAELTAENRKLVEAALEKYPYFSLGRMMLAKLATHLRDEHAAQHRFLGSLYAPSRQHYAFFLEEKLRPRVAPPPRLGAAVGREAQTSSPPSTPSREEEPSPDEPGPEGMPFSSAFWPPLQGWIAARRILYKGLTQKIMAQLYQYAQSSSSFTNPAPQIETPLPSPPVEESALVEEMPIPAENVAVEPELPSFPSEEASVPDTPTPIPQMPADAFVPPLEAVPEVENTEPVASVTSSEAEIIPTSSAELPSEITSIAEEEVVEQRSSSLPEIAQKQGPGIAEALLEPRLAVPPREKEKEGEPPLPPLAAWMLLQFELSPGKGLVKVTSEKASDLPETTPGSAEPAQAVPEPVQPIAQVALREEESPPPPSAEEKIVAPPIQAQEPETPASESTGGLHRRYIPLEETMASIHLSSGGAGAIPESSLAPSAESPSGGLHRAYIPLEETERSVHLPAEVSPPPEEPTTVQPSEQSQTPSLAESSTGGLQRKYISLEETMHSLSASSEKPLPPSLEEPPSGGLLGRYISLDETIASLQAERSRLSSAPIQEENPVVAAEPSPPPAEAELVSSVESVASESPLRPFVPLETDDSASVHLPVPEELPKTDITAAFPEGWRSFLKELKIEASAPPAKPATFSQELENLRRQFIKKLLEERAIRPHVPAAPPEVSLIDRVIEKLQTFPRSGSVAAEPEIPELSAPVRESTPTAPRIYTETMAKLYWSQGDLSRAIQIYEALIAKNPVKAEYYRGQIAKIQAGEMP